jgi:hypothetical protein
MTLSGIYESRVWLSELDGELCKFEEGFVGTVVDDPICHALLNKVVRMV